MIRGIKNLLAESENSDGFTVKELIKVLKKLDPNKHSAYLDTRDLKWKQETAESATQIVKFSSDTYLLK